MELTVFWSWNDNISENEISNQIKDFCSKGITGAFVHARSGLPFPWMGERWLDLFAFAVYEAKIRNFGIWIYDEMNWPSGNADGQIVRFGNRFREKKLKYSFVYDEKFSKEIIACYLKSANRYVLCDKCADADLYIYYEYATDSDKMYKHTGEKFIELVHEKYKERFGNFFGNVIKGVFFDESAIGFFYPTLEFPWSLSIPDKYAEIFDGDIKKDLWKLFFRKKDIDPFLHDYYYVCGELFRENFIMKIKDWCSANGLKMTGHFCMEENLHTSSKLSGSVMYNYKIMDVPGIDLLGRRVTSPLLYKQVSSVNHQFPKEDTLCEAFGSAGWDADFNQLLWAWKENALNGISMPCLHLASYSLRDDRKFDHPGFFSFQQPWWGCAEELFDQFKMYSSFLKGAKSTNDVLVISPTAMINSTEYQSSLSQGISNSYRQLLEELTAAQIGYDIGDEYIMAEDGYVSGKEIVIGQMKYGTVVVPHCYDICGKTLELLRDLYSGGGNVVFIEGYPETVSLRPDKELEALKNIWKKKENGLITFAKKKILIKAFDFLKYQRIVTVTDRYDGYYSAETEISCGYVGREMRIAVFNRSTDAFKKVRINIRGFNSVSEKTGYDMKVLSTGGGCSIDVDMYPTQMLMLVADNRIVVAERNERKTENVMQVMPEFKGLNSENLLVIDRAKIVCDGAQREEDFVGRIGRVEFKEKLVSMYSFEVKDEVGELSLLAEGAIFSSVKLNGAELINKAFGCYIDKSIILYDCGNAVKKGTNVIEIEYDKSKGAAFISAVMIKGSFDVEGKIFSEYPLYYSCLNEFFIVNASEKKSGELTKQGLWFYEGAAEYGFTYAYERGKVFLEFAEPNFITAEITVNGVRAAVVTDFFAPYEITGHLKQGENDISVIIYSGLRNVFGPHHHVMGVPNMVGYETFTGKKSFADIIYYKFLEGDVYRENYNCRKFDLGRIFIKNIITGD